MLLTKVLKDSSQMYGSGTGKPILSYDKCALSTCEVTESCQVTTEWLCWLLYPNKGGVRAQFAE